MIISNGIYLGCHKAPSSRPNCTNTSGSVGACTEKNGPRGLQKDFDIQPKGPPFRILEVQTNHIVEFEPAATAHLPQPGDPRLGLHHAAPVPDLILIQLVRNGGTRADKRHVALQYIEKLRKLVQAGFAQKLPYSGDARIVLNLVDDLLGANAGRVRFSSN